MIRAVQNEVDVAPLRMTVVTDAEEVAAFREQMARLALNSAWLQTHATEVYTAHRGKFIAIAGQELFVADTIQEAMAHARAAHPDASGYRSRPRHERSGDCPVRRRWRCRGCEVLLARALDRERPSPG